jgi:APA family basic amino acid/polyamine antiporter
VLVLVKVAALTLFVVYALPAFDGANLHPFMPFGFFQSVGADGTNRG